MRPQAAELDSRLLLMSSQGSIRLRNSFVKGDSKTREIGLKGNKVRWAKEGARVKARQEAVRMFSEPGVLAEVVRRRWSLSSKHDEARRRGLEQRENPEGITFLALPLLRRGFSDRQIADITGYSSRQISNLKFRLKRTGDLERSKAFGEIMRDAYADRKKDQEDPQKMKIVRKLIEAGLVTPSLTNWEALQKLCLQKKRDLSLLDRVRLEVFYEAVHAKLPEEKRKILEAYDQAGRNFGKGINRGSLDSDERFILTDRNNGWVAKLVEDNQTFFYTAARRYTNSQIDALAAVERAQYLMLQDLFPPEYLRNPRGYIVFAIKEARRAIHREKMAKKRGVGKIEEVFEEVYMDEEGRTRQSSVRYSPVRSAEDVALEYLEPDPPKQRRPEEAVVVEVYRRFSEGQMSERAAALQISQVTGKKFTEIRGILQRDRGMYGTGLHI